MLPERYRDLLAASVDGPLNPRQRRLLQQLLERSAEARRLLERLQSDSHELIRLPAPQLDRDLSPAILQKIAARRLSPIPRVRRFASAPVYPVWVGFAAAAAVLLVVSAASYVYFASFLNQPTAPTVMARVDHARSPIVPEVKNHDEVHNDIADAKPHVPADDKSKADLAPQPQPDSVASRKPTDAKPSVTPEKEEPIFTSEGMEMFAELKSVAPSLDLPATFKLRDLQQDAAHKKLVDELQKDSAVRLELPVPDGSRAFERLQAILKTHHVDLLIDASAQRRLAKPFWKTNYVLYSERGMTPTELASLLQQIGADKQPAGNPFDNLVVRRMTELDHKELSALLGVDPVQVQPSKQTGALGVDPRKPVSDQTAGQLAASLAGQGRGAAKPGEHTMLAMPYNPVRPRRDSGEVKRFLDERKPLRQGALQVLLVLRGPTG